MGKSGTFFFGLACGVFVHSGAAQAETGIPAGRSGRLPMLSETLAPFAVLDLSRRDIREGARKAPEDFDLRSQPEPESTRISLSLQETTVEGGPRFEIGAFGGHRGGVKRNLVHVAMDWAF